MTRDSWKVCYLSGILAVGLAIGLASGSGHAGEVKQYDRNSTKTDNLFVTGIDCDQAAQRLRIGLFDAYNVPDGWTARWRTLDLKQNDAAGENVARLLSVERTCRLKGARYRIRITGAPGNWNLNWTCGAVTFASARVWKDGRPVFDEVMGSCDDEHRLRLLTFRPESAQPERRQADTLAELLH